MGSFSVATGLTLLQDEGVLPPNPQRQAVAFASAAEATKLGSEGLALQHTATDLAMEDQSSDGIMLSTAAVQFLVQSLTTSSPAPAEPAAAKGASAEPSPHSSGYPSSGWSSSSADSTTRVATPSPAPAASVSSASPAVASAPAATPIDILA